MIPLFITIFYPKIVQILGFVGAFSGLFAIYFLPIVTYLKKLKDESNQKIIGGYMLDNKQMFQFENDLI